MSSRLLKADVVEAAALGDVATVARYSGDLDATAVHPSLPPGCTLLMAACSNGQNEVVQFLLEHGASVNLYASGGITGESAGRHSDPLHLPECRRSTPARQL